MTVIAKGSRQKEFWLALVLLAVATIPVARALMAPGGLVGFLGEATARDQLGLLMTPLMFGVGVWWLMKIHRNRAPDLVIQDGHLQQTGWFRPLAVKDIAGVNFKPGNILTKTQSRLSLELRDGSMLELPMIRLQGDGRLIADALISALGFKVDLPDHLRSRRRGAPRR